MKTFYIGLNNRLLMVQERENGFDIKTDFENIKVNLLAIDPKAPHRMYVATDEGIWKSENSGQHFVQSNHGLIETKVTAVAVSPTRMTQGKSTVYIGTEPSKLYYSEDYGESWQEYKGLQDLPSKSSWSFPPRPETHFVRWITPSETDKDYLAVSIEAGAVIYTTDHGRTWQDRAEVGPIDVHTLLKHPEMPARLYATNGGMVSNKSREAYAESSDGGYSWEFFSHGLEQHPYLYHLALHPNDPNYRLVSASKNAREAHRQPAYSTVYHKIGDEPWEEIADGLPKKGAFTHHLVNNPSEIGAFYALNNLGIFHLGAEDTTWKTIDIPWPDELKVMRPTFFVVQET